MGKLLRALFLGVSLMVLAVNTSWAGELDVLLEKLVDKGVLTPIEASIIADETKQRVAAEVTAGKSYAVPSWVQKMKIKQDLRLRHQYERKERDTDARSRFRVRYRLGFETKVASKVKAGAGLASGGSDPRSTNQTFQNFFDTPDIRLDYAYAEWAPTKEFKVIGGKFKRKPYLWAPTDLLWDGDINPEGVSAHYEKSLTGTTKGFANAGVWFLDENGKSDDPDPFMHYAQAGLAWKDGDFDAKVAGTYYGFNQVEGTDPDNSNDTNTRAGSNLLAFDYDSFGVSAEAGVKKPFGLPFKRVAIFGDYISNISEGVEEDTGWAAGVKFGDKKVSKPGTWQGKYIYARLERDAFLDTFPDSDRYGGDTNIKGHEFALNYALKKNVIIGVDYYNVDVIDGTENAEQVVQGDILFKF